MPQHEQHLDYDDFANELTFYDYSSHQVLQSNTLTPMELAELLLVAYSKLYEEISEQVYGVAAAKKPYAYSIIYDGNDNLITASTNNFASYVIGYDSNGKLVGVENLNKGTIARMESWDDVFFSVYIESIDALKAKILNQCKSNLNKVDLQLQIVHTPANVTKGDLICALTKVGEFPGAERPSKIVNALSYEKPHNNPNEFSCVVHDLKPGFSTLTGLYLSRVINGSRGEMGGSTSAEYLSLNITNIFNQLCTNYFRSKNNPGEDIRSFESNETLNAVEDSSLEQNCVEVFIENGEQFKLWLESIKNTINDPKWDTKGYTISFIAWEKMKKLPSGLESMRKLISSSGFDLLPLQDQFDQIKKIAQQRMSLSRFEFFLKRDPEVHNFYNNMLNTLITFNPSPST